MKKIFLILYFLLPATGYTQNCDWRKTELNANGQLIFTALDKPFFSISDVVLAKKNWKVKPLHSKYNVVPVEYIGNNAYMFTVNSNKFAISYPEYQNDENFELYKVFSNGGMYVAKLFYKQGCTKVDYMEISVTQKQNGKTYKLKQRFMPVKNLQRYG